MNIYKDNPYHGCKKFVRKKIKKGKHVWCNASVCATKWESNVLIVAYVRGVYMDDHGHTWNFVNKGNQ